MKLADHPRAKGFSKDIIRYIEDVYSRANRGTLDQRRKRHTVEETPEIRELAAWYISYFVYDDEFMHLIAKEELLRKSIAIMREINEDTQKNKEMLDLQAKADTVCDKLVQDIKSLRAAIYGDKQEEGKEVIRKAITPEDRVFIKTKQV